MHRAAFAVAETVFFTRKLQQHRLDFTTLGNAVAMTAMRTGDVILVGHIKTGGDRDRFLIAIDMDKPGQLALLVFRAHALLELADGFHQPIGIGQLFRSKGLSRHIFIAFDIFDERLTD